VSTPAGWYADQTYTGRLRYWDGVQWTNHWAPVPLTVPPYQPRRIGFTDAVGRAFRQYARFSGRATVAEYWWFYLFTLLVCAPLYLVVIVTAGGAAQSTGADGQPTLSRGAAIVVLAAALLLTLCVLGFLLPQLALTVRRLHDTGRSGWFVLLAIVPLASLVLLVFLIERSKPGPNRYGPPAH